VRDSIAAWLEVYGTALEADFVCTAWLEAKGEFSLVQLPAMNWLRLYSDRAEAVYITKFLAKQRDIALDTVADILTWCCTFPTHEDAIWRLTQLRWHLLKPEIAEKVILTCEAVLRPLILGDIPLKPVTRGQTTTLFSYLIGARGLRADSLRPRVDALLLAWLRHPLSFGPYPLPHTAVQRTAYVQRIVDLLGSGDLSPTRDRQHLEKFLQWVDNWDSERKLQLLSIFNLLQRRYPETDLWDIVEF